MSRQSVGENPAGPTLSEVPAIRTFDFDDNAIGAVKSSVNNFRGSVSLPIDLLTLPGHEGLDVKVSAIYSSNVRKSVETSNVEAPTGVIGLGWEMPIERITVVKGGSGSHTSDRYFLIANGSASPMVKTGTVDGRWRFQLRNHEFWRIEFEPASSVWRITHENGFVYTYGGSDEAGASQWGVKWGNWIGSSSEISNQDRFTVSWNLASIVSPWGHRVTYTYENVNSTVADGVPEFTQASYLKSMTDSFGRTVTFFYSEKFGALNPSARGIVEYQALHSARPEPNAYQDRYETRYLSHISVANAPGLPLYDLDFTYDFLNVAATDDPSFALLWKRCLTGVSRRAPNGRTVPGLRFSYAGEDDVNPGALTSVTYPTGGTARFSYKKNFIDAPKKETVRNPLPGSTPGVWHGDDYVVFTYVGSSGGLHALVYSWNGRWVKETIFEDASIEVAPESLWVTAESGYIALFFRNRASRRDELRLYRKDVSDFGTWVPAAQGPVTFELSSDDAGPSQLAPGRDFVVAYNPAYAAGAFQGLSYDWRDRSWSPPPILPSSAGTGVAGRRIEAWDNFYVVASYDAGARQLQFEVLYRELDGAWRAAPAWRDNDIDITLADGRPQFTIDVQPTHVAATYRTGGSGEEIEYSVRVFQWNEEFYVLNAGAPAGAELEAARPFATISRGSWINNRVANFRNIGGPQDSQINWLRKDFRSPLTADAVTAVGDDVAVFCAGKDGGPNELLVFDANDSSDSGWSQPAVTQEGAHGTANGDYVTVGSTIYSRGTDGRWDAVQSKLVGLGAADSVQNRAPSYIAYESGDGADATSLVVKLENRQAETAVELPGGPQKIHVPRDEAAPGTVLAGRRFLVSYPSSESFKQADALELYNLDDGELSDFAFDFPVAVVEIEDAYDAELSYHQSFFYLNSQESQIAYDPATGITQYPLVIVVPGIASTGDQPPARQPHGRTEYAYSNGLSPHAGLFPDGGLTNYRNLLNGMLLSRTDFDADNQVVERQLNYWAVYTDDPESPGSSLFGGYVRHVRTRRSRDGVVWDETAEFDDRTGMEIARTKSYSDADGVAKRLRTEATYAHQVPVYRDAFLKRHVLTAIVQSTKSVTAADGGPANYIGSHVTTYREWSTGEPAPVSAGDGAARLAPHRVFQWTEPGPNAPVFDFTESSGAEPDGWLSSSTIARRSGRSGAVEEVVDAAGATTSFVYDDAERYVVAKFQDGSRHGQEVSYCGFEAHEDCADWVLGSGARVVPETADGAVDAHTGTRSVRLDAGSSGLTASFAPARADQPYLFSAWVKKPQGFDAGSGQARWRIEADGVEIVADFPEEVGAWAYISKVIPAPASSVSITAENANTSSFVLVDDVRFSPFGCPFNATSYDTRFWLPTSHLAENGQTSRTTYDDFAQPRVGTNRSDEVSRIEARYFSRSGNGGDFATEDPNHHLTIAPGGRGSLSTFTRGSEWERSWTGTPNVWTRTGAVLTQRAEATAGCLTLRDDGVPSDFALTADVEPCEPVGAPMGLRLGTSYAVSWNPEASRWELLDGSGTVVTADEPAQASSEGEERAAEAREPGTNWVAVIARRTILFWADGRLVFSHHANAAFDARPELFFGSRVSISELCFAVQPSTSVQFTDARGNRTQEQRLTDAGMIVTQNITDRLGRSAVSTKAATILPSAAPPLRYLGGFASLDWSTGELGGLVADAFPGDGGYAYTRHLFSASPLSRVVEQANPGAAFRVGAHTTRVSYGESDDGKHFKTTTTNPNGDVLYELTDLFDRTIATVSVEGDGEVRNETFYDDAGNAVRRRAPNYFDPPAGSSASDWVQHQTFDFAGRPTLSRWGDRAASRWMYDRAGRLRFSQDPQGAAVGNLDYVTYDRIGRPKEEGFLSAAWDDSELRLRAEEPAWPPSPDTWRKRLSYDGDDAMSHRVGRVAELHVNNGAQGEAGVVERFGYDRAGHVTRHGLAVRTFGPDEYVVSYAYNTRGSVTRITYPALGDDEALAVHYRRNNLDQVTAISESPDFSDVLASYQYEASGAPERETLALGPGDPMTRSFGYNSAMWLERVHQRNGDGDSVFDERLTYTEGAAGDRPGYYDGVIASTHSVREADQLSFHYAYDALGQIEVARSPDQEGWSLGSAAPIRYDANGNFETMTVGGRERRYSYFEGTQRVRQVTDGTSGDALASFDYDENGNATAARTAATQLSPARDLTMAYDPGTSLVTTARDAEAHVAVDFEYGSADRRVLKSVRNGQSTSVRKLYVRGINAYPLCEVTTDGPEMHPTFYIFGPTGMIAMRKGATTYGIVKDHLGSVRAVVDASGGLVARYDYLTFGALARVEEPEAGFMPYLFTGQEFDHEIGLYNYRARFYSGDLGRFVGVDPHHQYFSPYLYASNNPVLLVDPTGGISTFARVMIGIGLTVLALGATVAAIYTGGLLAPAAIAAWGAVGTAVGVGATAAAIATAVGYTAAAVAVGAAIGAVAGAAAGGAIYSFGTRNEDFNARGFGQAVAMGAVTGAVAGGVTAGLNIAGQAIATSVTGVTNAAATTAARSGGLTSRAMRVFVLRSAVVRGTTAAASNASTTAVQAVVTNQWGLGTTEPGDLALSILGSAGMGAVTGGVMGGGQAAYTATAGPTVDFVWSLFSTKGKVVVGTVGAVVAVSGATAYYYHAGQGIRRPEDE